MNTHLLSHLLLHKPINYSSSLLSHPQLKNRHFKSAAVLVPIVKRETGFNLILTQRAPHLRHHPSQISFPGGKVEPGDLSLIHTAIRETNEEIGINPAHIKPLVKLNTIPTISGYKVTPIVALIDENYTTAIDYGEVSSTFEAPINHLINPKNTYNHHVFNKNHTYNLIFIPFDKKLIWGVTAEIIHAMNYITT
ncbi:CoA pyrophosphatase [Aliivibrio fischeri]|uniref:CoA pyrophosphatase n=1 Tax=Aliivibrio fischeri TaxID=668 RepID=UPI0012D87F69|nr:CoA pyrophosphatase [Aliivibrio fischeri]MUK60920.1 CoA pyrophosphatase [Aliivibrio fischeri]MUK69737.1 CoA pyrophosphatase [Aliivibrio fischeri]MUK72271.1 CoA pyrophosphatase [Aliivibrio fischeri]MUK78878.1 CoA pyrophosphatase [Aliivibrio fischeri]MUL20574.1 CoA pyrophosphatase [Aliivibrio fischeri]